VVVTAKERFRLGTSFEERVPKSPLNMREPSSRTIPLTSIKGILTMPTLSKFQPERIQNTIERALLPTSDGGRTLTAAERAEIEALLASAPNVAAHEYLGLLKFTGRYQGMDLTQLRPTGDLTEQLRALEQAATRAGSEGGRQITENEFFEISQLASRSFGGDEFMNRHFTDVLARGGKPDFTDTGRLERDIYFATRHTAEFWVYDTESLDVSARQRMAIRGAPENPAAAVRANALVDAALAEAPAGRQLVGFEQLSTIIDTLEGEFGQSLGGLSAVRALQGRVLDMDRYAKRGVSDFLESVFPMGPAPTAP
jgi:hypothetical protein